MEVLADRALDATSVADAVARWQAGELGEAVGADVLAELRHELEGAARHAAAGIGVLPAGPVRLSKRRISDLLACERHLVVTAGAVDDRSGPGNEALHVGVLVDVLAEVHVARGAAAVDGGAPRPATGTLAEARALCLAHGDGHGATVDWVDALTPDDRTRVADVLEERRRGLLAGWPAFEASWWPRTQERASVALADGDVVLDGRADVVVGGPPTPWPALVLEVKAGGFGLEQRDDGLVYALLLALRDGVAPAAAVTTTALGLVHLEPVTPDRLRTAVLRLTAALAAAGRIGAGEPPVERAGWRCDRCPVRAGCATAHADRR